MPNLVGLYTPDSNKEKTGKLLQRQLHAIDASGFNYDEYIHISRSFGLGLLDHGVFSNGVQPVYARNGDLLLALDGEVNNIEELAKRHRLGVDCARSSPPQICLSLIAHFGPQAAKEFNGAFAIVLYDIEAEELILISDRLGIRPLFFVAKDTGCAFSTELKGLIAIENSEPPLDELGILELFSFKNHVCGRTWLKGYTRLAPGTILTASRKGSISTAYFEYKYDEKATKLDQVTYSTVYAKLVDRSVERCMQGNSRVGLFLSGGYDSRAIAGAIRSHHLPIPAVTFGDPGSRDAVFASEIAARLGFEHEIISRHGAYLYEHASSIAWRTEGMIAFANTTSISIHDRLKKRMDIILAGFLGEFSGSHVWPKLLMARTRQQAIDAIFNHLVGRRLVRVSRIFDDRFFSKNIEALRHVFETSFDEIDNDNPVNIADAWNFRYLHPQETYQAPAIDRHLFELRTPLTDNDLVDFLLTIPPLSRIEQRVYKRMIVDAYPDLADVPCTNSGRPIDPNFVREYLNMALRYGLRKAKAPIYRARRQSPLQTREFRNLAEDFRAEPELVTGLLAPMLQAGVYPTNIFNHAGIEDIVSSHYDRRANHEDIISNLIGWGLAARSLLNRDHNGIDSKLLPG